MLNKKIPVGFIMMITINENITTYAPDAKRAGDTSALYGL